MNTYILIAVIAMVAVEIASIIATIIFIKTYKSICDGTVLKYMESMDSMRRADLERFRDISDKYEKVIDSGDSIIKTISEQYDTMIEIFHSIENIQTKALECWKGIENRYSDSYDQYRLCTKKLDEINKQLSNLAKKKKHD